MRPRLFLNDMKGGTDLALLALRLFLGAFLIHGVWDNIVSAERMTEFVGFLTGLNCPCPRSPRRCQSGPSSRSGCC